MEKEYVHGLFSLAGIAFGKFLSVFKRKPKDVTEIIEEQFVIETKTTTTIKRIQTKSSSSK